MSEQSGFACGTIALLATLGMSEAAFAQQKPVNDGWGLMVGAGALYAPAYEGDDSYRLSVLPNLQITYGESFFASVQEGIGYRWINSQHVRSGPIARVKFARSEDGEQSFAISGEDTEDLRGLGDVDASIELGGFLEYDIGPVTLSAEARQAVSGHEGFVADVGARWSGSSLAFGPPVIWSIGPRVRFVDESYNEAYSGVDGSQSLASGLEVFAATGGLHSYGVGATAVIPLTRDNAWAAVVFAGYDRLSGDAGSSPLVQQRGSEDQASIGLVLSYRAF